MEGCNADLRTGKRTNSLLSHGHDLTFWWKMPAVDSMNSHYPDREKKPWFANQSMYKFLWLKQCMMMKKHFQVQLKSWHICKFCKCMTFELLVGFLQLFVCICFAETKITNHLFSQKFHAQLNFLSNHFEKFSWAKIKANIIVAVAMTKMACKKEFHFLNSCKNNTLQSWHAKQAKFEHQ